MTFELHENARVARGRLGFIVPTATAGGDAPPIADTHPDATPGRKVEWHSQRLPPRRFTAINLPATPIVISMITVVLILTSHAITTVTDRRVNVVQVLSVVIGLTITAAVVVVAAILASRRRMRRRSMTSPSPAGDGIVDPWFVVLDDVDDDGSELVVLGRFVTAPDDPFRGGPRPGGRRPEPASPQREGVRQGAPPKAASRAALGNTENSLPFPADDPEAHQ